MSTKKSWSQLSQAQRRLVVAAGTLQVGLQLAALHDLRHRAPETIRGPRWVWTCATFVNTIGPGAYFLFGRRRH